MKYYYGFQYWGGRNTTTGNCNRLTGRYSIAGDVKVFYNLADLKNWLDQPYRRDSREKVSLKKLRSLCQGMTVKDFYEMIYCIVE